MVSCNQKYSEVIDLIKSLLFITQQIDALTQ